MQRETGNRWLSAPGRLISILSLYAEGDFMVMSTGDSNYAISILSLYAEGDTDYKFDDSAILISILSLYAEGDPGVIASATRLIGISILSLYAEGDYRKWKQRIDRAEISILSLYAEGDLSDISAAI